MDLFALLRYSAPVALASIGETISEEAGVINIGLEGSMLCAAFFGMLVTYGAGSPWLGICAAVATGAALHFISGLFTILLGADQVVIGTAVNLFALGFTGALFRSHFGQSGKLLSVAVLPSWPVLIVLVASAPLTWLLLFRSRWGLAVRATGEYPPAAEAAGFSVARLRLSAVTLAGAFAGLAGGYLALGLAGSFSEGITAGRGFVAIALVTFGRWRPHLVFLAALLIGYLESLQFRFQSFGWRVPFQLFIALPYIVALLVLVVVGKGTAAPGALAQPYRREK